MILKKIILILVVITSTLITDAQTTTCKVQGVVRYYFNDYQGYKPDLGAEIYIVPKKEKDTIPHYKNWVEYEELINKKISYLKYHEYLPKIEAERFSGYKEAYDSLITNNSFICLSDRIAIEDRLAKFTVIIDASGLYSIQLPYGTYYFLFKSKNRTRGSVLEFQNRYYIKEIKIDKPTLMISFDFEM